jgi:hypothetical protein
VTCSFSGFVSLLGVSHPRIPPSDPIAFPLVTALRVVPGGFPALVVIYITPGQSLYLEKVELGGIEPSHNSRCGPAQNT